MIIAIGLHVDRFMFHFDTKVYSAEASELGRFKSRAFDDACDEGFVMINSVGEKQLFILDNTEEDDGDVLAWHFIPYRPNSRHDGQRVIIFND